MVVPIRACLEASVVVVCGLSMACDSPGGTSGPDTSSPDTSTPDTSTPDTTGSGEAPTGFVRVPAGVFMMGSPSIEEDRQDDETQHEVRVTRAFWLKTTEVTQGEWQSVMSSNPSQFSSCGSTCPVETVSWEDATLYLNATSDLEGLERCYENDGSFKGLDCTGYRLPTEAEWEYAARAGTVGARYGLLDSIAWYEDNEGTKPAGMKAPNAWGLHDMLGNVWEWVQDWYGEYGGDASDPLGPTTGEYRVLRGGSWDFAAFDVRVANRLWLPPDLRFSANGFRVARSIP